MERTAKKEYTGELNCKRTIVKILFYYSLKIKNGRMEERKKRHEAYFLYEYFSTVFVGFYHIEEFTRSIYSENNVSSKPKNLKSFILNGYSIPIK